MSSSPDLTRRSFLSRTALCGVAALLSPAARSICAEKIEAPAQRWQIGCYTRCFDQFDYRVGLDAIAEAGFKYVGLMTSNAKQWVIIKPETPAEEVRRLREEADKRGLKVLSVYGEFRVADTTRSAVQALRNLIDHCATCGCPNLLLGGTTDPKVYEGYYETIRECCTYAAEKQVSMSIKPHGGQNATGPQCRKAIELVNRPNFGLWYDPGNIFYYSEGKLDPVEDAGTVGGLVVGMSVKDFQPPKNVLVNPGTGKVDFPKVLAQLGKGGFSHGPLIVECLERGELKQVTTAASKARLFIESLVVV